MNKQLVVYGGPGIGKTNTVASLAKWLWKKQQKRTLVVTLDGGGAGPLQPGIDAGAIELVQGYPKNPFVSLTRLSQGYKPIMEEGSSDFKKWVKVDWKKEGFGALCMEGLTSWGDCILDWAREKHASGEQIGAMDGEKMGFFSDGEGGDKIKLGANTMAHYSIAQSYLRTFVDRHKALWDQGCPIIMWTALEMRSQDENKVPVYGPHLAGKAASGTCIRWFTDVLHLSVVDPKKQPDGSIRGDRRIFLENHFEPGDPVPFRAKSSAPSEGKMPSVISPDMGVFFEELERANGRALEGWK